MFTLEVDCKFFPGLPMDIHQFYQLLLFLLGPHPIGSSTIVFPFEQPDMPGIAHLGCPPRHLGSYLGPPHFFIHQIEEEIIFFWSPDLLPHLVSCFLELLNPHAQAFRTRIDFFFILLLSFQKRNERLLGGLGGLLLGCRSVGWIVILIKGEGEKRKEH